MAYAVLERIDSCVSGQFVSAPRSSPVMVFDRRCKEPWLVELREAVKKSQRAAQVMPIKPMVSLTAVGASYNGEGLSGQDWLCVRDTLELCTEMRLPIAEDFCLTVMNVDSNGKGDFLNEKRATDIVVVCSVFNGPVYGDPSPFVKSQSKDHHVAGAWHEAARQVGAQVVTTYGRDVDVDSKTFAPPSGRDAFYIEQRISAGRNSPDNLRGVLLRIDTDALVGSRVLGNNPQRKQLVGHVSPR